MKTGREEQAGRRRSPLRGIVITRGEATPPREPKVAAFIWGGKVRPTPTLPYGRWKAYR